MSKGLLLVVSGPSGVGKGTVCAEYMKTHPDTVLSVSVTERAPRVGEIDGVHYYFKTKQEFDRLVENDGLLEWAQYGDNRYGTPKDPVMKALEQGKDVILEIEVVGAMKVRSHYPEGVYIFVVPPEMSDLRARLQKRATENDDQVSKRLAKAMIEFKHMEKYNYIITNDRLDDAVLQLDHIVSVEKVRVERSIEQIKTKLRI